MKKIIIFYLLIIITHINLNAQTNRNIQIDYNKIKGKLNTSFKACIGAGRANEGLRADWQEQLKLIKAACGFKYIRMHGLLNDDMGVYQEDKVGNPIYNWQYIDVLYDYLLSINMKPFVELGFMPNALASGNKTIFWWKGNVTYPKNEKKWADLISALTKHFTERYGEAEIKTWYFEVWNEPNLKGFFDAEMKDYFQLYKITAEAIKSINTNYKVGGPATAGSAWIPEFINYCSVNKVPVDFVSTHTYGVKSGFLDIDGNAGTILSSNKNAVSSEMVNSKKQITNSALPNLELHYTEWSSSYTPADPVHDNYIEAAFILDKIKNAGNSVNSMSYWTFTDIFEENGPRTTPFHGGFGLLNYQSIQKPAFYAYQFLHKLGETELINNDSASFICKDATGNMQLLLWDFSLPKMPDSMNDQIYFKKDLPSTLKSTVSFYLKNLPKGNYKVEIYKTGYRTNDAFSTYLDMASPNQLTKIQVKTIKEKNNGQPIITYLVNANQTNIIKQISLNQNDVLFINIKKL